MNSFHSNLNRRREFFFSSLESRFGAGGNSLKRKTLRKRLISNVDALVAAALVHNPKDWNLQDAKHHRHWQKPLKQTMGLFLSTLGVPLPQSGTVLGGTMELHGKNISLACFHGINFKSKSWAIFSLREPCIHFATEAQQI